MNSSHTLRSVLAAGAMALLSACGGGSMSVPNALPIVKGALPATLESSAATRMSSMAFASPLAVDSNITALKSRFFDGATAGPTDFQYRLKMIDSRMDELEEDGGDCEGKDAQAWSVPVGTTGITLSTMYFQCYTTVTGPGVSDYKIYFGKKDGYWYLAELQINDAFESGDGEPPTMAVLAKIAEDSTTVEAWQISVEKVAGSYYSTMTQILANQSTGVFEVSSASSAGTSTITPGANYTGLGCGVQMKTDGTNIKASGIFSQGTCSSSAAPCVLASNFDTTGASCSSISTFGTVAMTQSGLISASAGATAKAIIVDKTGIPTVDLLVRGGN